MDRYVSGEIIRAVRWRLDGLEKLHPGLEFFDVFLIGSECVTNVVLPGVIHYIKNPIEIKL